MLIQSLFAGELPALVMFDLDGTLVDSVPDLALAVDQMLADFGAQAAGEARVRVWVGNGAAVLVQRALEYAQLSVDHAVALACFKQHYAVHLNVATQVYPGVVTLLDKLRVLGVRMAVVTNKPEQFTLPLLESMGLAEYFSDVLSGDTLPAKKPDPLPLQYLCEKYALSPAQVLMVGDSVNDVKAALAAGCVAVVVPYGYHQGVNVASMGAHRVVQSLRDLVK